MTFIITLPEVWVHGEVMMRKNPKDPGVRSDQIPGFGWVFANDNVYPVI